MDGYLHLTAEGRAVAEKIYEKHRFLTNFFIEIGVDPAQAEEDACKIEHGLSEESYMKLKERKRG